GRVTSNNHGGNWNEVLQFLPIVVGSIGLLGIGAIVAWLKDQKHRIAIDEIGLSISTEIHGLPAFTIEIPWSQLKDIRVVPRGTFSKEKLFNLRISTAGPYSVINVKLEDASASLPLGNLLSAVSTRAPDACKKLRLPGLKMESNAPSYTQLWLRYFS